MREIQAFLAETVAWQNRPLERMYPVVFFDALRVKIRSDGLQPRSCCAPGVSRSGLLLGRLRGFAHTLNP